MTSGIRSSCSLQRLSESVDPRLAWRRRFLAMHRDAERIACGGPTPRLAALVVLLLLTASAMPLHAFAATPTGQIEIVPASLTVHASGASNISVVFTNTDTKPLSDIQIALSLPRGVAASPESGSALVLATGGSVSWQFEIAASSAHAKPGDILVSASWTGLVDAVVVTYASVASIGLTLVEGPTPGPKLDASIVPTALILPSVGGVRGSILITNRTGHEARQIEPTITTPDGVGVVGALDPIPLLAHGSSTALDFRLVQSGTVPVPSHVLVRLEYELGDPPRSDTIDLAVEIDRPTTSTGSHLSTVDVLTALESLSHERPGRIALVITNSTASRLTLISVRLSGPNTIEFKPADDRFAPPDKATTLVTLEPGAIVLEPGASVQVPFVVEAKSAVQPGKTTLTFEVTTQTMDELVPRTDTVVASKDVTLGVLGESEALQLLQVPTVLFLPGFVAMATISLFWRAGIKPWSSAATAFGFTTAEFWFFALLASIVIVFGYIVMTGRNILTSYSLGDLIAISIGSVTVAAVAWVGIAGVVGFVRRNMNTRRYPTVSDDALTVLVKLGRRNQSVGVPVVAIAEPAPPKQYLLLEPRDASRAHLLVGPYIGVRFMNATEDSIRCVQELRRANASTRDLARVLGQLKRRGQVTVAWKAFGEVTAPRLVDKESVPAPSGSDLIVQVEP